MQENKTLKIRYFNCKKGGQHSGQVLNYVCIDKKCNNRGLLCSICKSENHKDHNVIPLKILLQRLQHHHQQPMQSQNFQDHIGSIQNIRNELLYELKLCVQQIAQRFRQLEKHIIQNFSKVKVQLLEQIQLNMKFQAIIRDALNSQIQQQQQQTFQQDIARISTLIDFNQNNRNVNFQINLSKIVAAYQKERKTIGSILTTIQGDLSVLLNNQKLENSFKKKLIFDKPQENQNNNNLKKLNYTFSAITKAQLTHKHRSTITLENSNKLARQTEAGPTRFVLVSQGIGSQQQSISIKIAKLKNWIGIGIGLKDVLAVHKYHFNYNALGHGSYLVSSNGFTWSHSQKADNIVSKDFNFSEGDIIDVTLKYPEELTFKRRKDNKILTMKINLNTSEWPQVCFCANLCSKDDSVEITE